jgi:hypothetical protein
MYFLDSTAMIQIAMDRQRDLSRRSMIQSQLSGKNGAAKKSGKTLQHSAGAVLVRIGRHLQA